MSIIVERILLDSSNSGYGSILELNNGLFAWQADYEVYSQGDEIDDYYRSIDGFQFGDVTLESVVLSDWEDDGPKFYFFNGDSLYSQDFRERDDLLVTDGTLQVVDQDRLYDLENQHNKDLNEDDEIPAASS